jgi:uncharacterized membrane protein (Fun14 family)
VSVTFGHGGVLAFADVDVRKVVIAVVVIFVLFFVISQPQGAANLVNDILRLLAEAANSVVLFLRRLF